MSALLVSLSLTLAAAAPARCSDPAAIIGARGVLAFEEAPDSSWWSKGIDIDREHGVDTKLEAVIALPETGRAPLKSWALVISCRSKAAGADDPVDSEHAIHLRSISKRAQKALAPEVVEAIPLGDRELELRAIMPSIADINGDGRGELCLRGSMIDRRGGARVQGEAEWFVFLGGAHARPARACTNGEELVDPAVLRVARRARRTTTDAAGGLSGISARVRADSDARGPSQTMILEETRHDARNESELDQWWSDSSGVDVLASPTSVRRFRWSSKAKRLEESCDRLSGNGTRTSSAGASRRHLVQASDRTLDIVQAGKKVRTLQFPASIVRVVRNANLLYAAVYVALEDGDATELFLVDMSTVAMRRFPRSAHAEPVLWAWSPDGGFAVSSIEARGPLVVHSVPDVDRWISGGAMSKIEVRSPDSAREERHHRFIRWTSNESFELASSCCGSATHYRYDIATRRLVRLYTRDDTVL